MWHFGAYKERIAFLSSIVGAFLSGFGVIVPLWVSSNAVPWWVVALIVAFFYPNGANHDNCPESRRQPPVCTAQTTKRAFVIICCTG